ncbi:MAG: hypothetical protein BWY63_00636 [Chloroflexi bacterium ADurb.Bin360]|nr:MAG: hypothetical protein BWY63_00636 [Chloroflexi bacterium ADurb.Bin360]
MIHHNQISALSAKIGLLVITKVRQWAFLTRTFTLFSPQRRQERFENRKGFLHPIIECIQHAIRGSTQPRKEISPDKTFFGVKRGVIELGVDRRKTLHTDIVIDSFKHLDTKRCLFAQTLSQPC